MAIVLVRDLKPYQPNDSIKVRVCRMWRPKKHKSENEYCGLHCILVDEMRDAIEGVIEEIDLAVVAQTIQPGYTYLISHFIARKSKSFFQVVPHVASLYFNGRTTFRELFDVHPAIPRHRFYLIDYSLLSPRTNNNFILTDVLGRITAVQGPEEKLIDNTRVETNCDIFIQNIRKEHLTVTLWADPAKAFNLEVLCQLIPPVFVVFTSLKVKEFRGNIVLNSTISTSISLNPDIPELESYGTVFKNFTSPVRMLQPSTLSHLAPEQMENTKKLSINEINILDPDMHKDSFFMCKATIARFDTHGGWWYKACQLCYKQLKSHPNSGQLLCSKHNTKEQTPLPCFKMRLVLEDKTDETNVIILGKAAERLFETSCYHLVVERGYRNPSIFPPELQRVIGLCRIFRLHFGTVRADFNRCDLLIHATF